LAVVQYTLTQKQYTEQGNGKRHSQDETSKTVESRETSQIKGFARKIGRRGCFWWKTNMKETVLEL